MSEIGYDAIHARDVGLKGKKDAEILAYATRAGRYLVTLDADFADLRRYPVGTHGGVIRLRLSVASSKVVLEVLRSLLPKLAGLKPGALVVSSSHRYRVRQREVEL